MSQNVVWGSWVHEPLVRDANSSGRIPIIVAADPPDRQYIAVRRMNISFCDHFRVISECRCIQSWFSILTQRSEEGPQLLFALYAPLLFNSSHNVDGIWPHGFHSSSHILVSKTACEDKRNRPEPLDH